MNDHVIIGINPWSNLFLLLGLFVSVVLWAKRPRQSSDNVPILMGGLIGGFLGAKLSFVLSEWAVWRDSPWLLVQLLYGKSILGGLLGGWAGVEIAKLMTGLKQRTGDEFARIIPVGIGMGRLSCLAHGCCLGQESDALPWPSIGKFLESIGMQRWPAPVVEIGFQILFLITSYSLRNKPSLRDQHFHLYMISYGLFRFCHEWLRDTPRYFGDSFSPYQLIAATCFIAGMWAFWKRSRMDHSHNRDGG
ncbi:MAG: prolipoprotein diacylglyceryl transferase [Planctomycetaceae bacterium]|nr:prolipoprotein diacylglyceryl transferase [Planctomycetaceae bacterium]